MKIWGIGQISPSEKSDILSQHKELYNGYRTMLPNVSNTQPLYVQDFANDKNGLVVNNKGEVKKYTNMGINEQTEPKEVCDECGGMMMEKECMECGWKGEVGAMEEETGHLEDIYKVEDINKSNEFDYVKENESEIDEIEVDKIVKGKKYKYHTPAFDDEVEFDDEFIGKEDKEPMLKFKGRDKMAHLLSRKHVEDFVDSLDEQGGNADDMDVDDVAPAYDFQSNGPMDGGDVYPVNEYETMESAWSDEIDEVDISGVQGVYGDMKSAYDFDSEGPGKAGPYQHSSYNEEYEGEDEDAYWEKDLEDGELDLDLTKFNPEDKSWEEITAYTGDDEFSYLDEDIKESFLQQKNRISEMFQRMKVIK
jgi:hypothetical protein